MNFKLNNLQIYENVLYLCWEVVSNEDTGGFKKAP